MSKYIIELDDRIKLVTSVGVTENGVVYTTSDYVHNLEELNSDYINEHFGWLQDDAYQRGLDEAWEAARKISLMSPDEIEKVFPGAAKYNRYNLGYSGVEAIEELKAYEEKQNDKIEVGDEVAFHHDDGRPDTVVVVTYIGQDGFIDGMDGRGTQYAHKNPTKWTKTGRHFDIASILEDMRNE